MYINDLYLLDNIGPEHMLGRKSAVGHGHLREQIRQPWITVRCTLNVHPYGI
jgi:hypothetical protein